MSKSVSSSLIAPDSSLLMSSNAFRSRDMASMASSCSRKISRYSSSLFIRRRAPLSRPSVCRGWRRSWLAVARKRLLARLACSASRRASLSAFSVSLALSDVTDGCSHHDFAALFDGAQADLDRELGAVLAHAEQLEADTHRTDTHVVSVGAAMADMTCAESFGQQGLDGTLDQVRRRIAEQRGNLAVGKENLPRRIDDDHRVRGRIKNAADELGGEHWVKDNRVGWRGRIASAVLHRKGLRRRSPGTYPQDP